MARRTIDLLPMHPAQRTVYDNPARFRVICAGRRWGKGVLSANIELATGLLGGRCWHVSPDFSMGEIHWRLLTGLAAQLPGVEVRQSDRFIAFNGGGYLQLKSNLQLLKGEGLDLAVLDESAYIPDLERVWQNDIRPMLSDRRGKALFTSTPFGTGNFFYQAFVWGQDDTRPDWQSWQFPTASNPTIPKDEIEAARQSMPAAIFEQEYLGLFLSDNAGVFRNIAEVCCLQPQNKPLDGHTYVGGLDTGRSGDYTVLSIIDATTKQQAYLDRFTAVSWHVQQDRIKALSEHWRLTAIQTEINGIGQPNFEALAAAGVPVRAFTTTNESKATLIESLALAMEHGALGEKDGVTLLADPVLIGELRAFGMDRLPSGKYRYGASGSAHDDTVIGTALSWHGVQRGDQRAYSSPVNPFYDSAGGYDLADWQYFASAPQIRTLTGVTEVRAATLAEGIDWRDRDFVPTPIDFSTADKPDWYSHAKLKVTRARHNGSTTYYTVCMRRYELVEVLYPSPAMGNLVCEHCLRAEGATR